MIVAALLAVACATPVKRQADAPVTPVPILSSDVNASPDGSYQYS